MDSSNRNGKVTTSESGVEGVRLNAQCTFKGHTDTVEDVAFHPTDSNTLCSVSDDTRLLFWDSAVRSRETGERGESERSRRPRGRLERAEYEFNRDWW